MADKEGGRDERGKEESKPAGKSSGATEEGLLGGGVPSAADDVEEKHRQATQQRPDKGGVEDNANEHG